MRRPDAASSLVSGPGPVSSARLDVAERHQPAPHPQPIPAVGGQQCQVTGQARREDDSLEPTPNALRLLATGTLNSTSSGSPAMAGRRSRTATTSTRIASQADARRRHQAHWP